MSKVNPMLASANRIVTVTVEYNITATCTARVRKVFTGAGAVGASRRFYAAKLKAGRNPKVVGAARHGEE